MTEETRMEPERERMLQAVMSRRNCDREEAEVIMRRIADRLGGYTHDEVARMHPLPGEAGNASLDVGDDEDG